MDDDAAYNQIAIFTSSAADTIEISNYMQDEYVIQTRGLLRSVQVIFGLSVTQFSFSLGAVKSRNLKRTGFLKFVDIVLSTEAWTLLISIFSQELPCLILRIILVISLKPTNEYSLYFFVLKNGLMTILLTYRVLVLIVRQYRKERTISPSNQLRD